MRGFLRKQAKIFVKIKSWNPLWFAGFQLSLLAYKDAPECDGALSLLFIKGAVIQDSVIRVINGYGNILCMHQKCVGCIIPIF